MSSAVGPSEAWDMRPLSARSVILSLMLGAHPQPMTSREVVDAGELFGIPIATTRVALTRAVAAGDLRREDSAYVLGQRLIERQVRQEEAVQDAERAWDGEWEMAVVTVSGRPGTERAALRERLTRARLSELREGVWTRPANLSRPARYADDPVLAIFRARPDGDPVELANQLWDLDGWAAEGDLWLHRLSTATGAANRLAVAAHLVRHLTSDPLLPQALLPPDWPGTALRAAYAEYQDELRRASRSSLP